MRIGSIFRRYGLGIAARSTASAARPTLVYLAPDELARRYGLSAEESARLARIEAIVDAVIA